MASARARMLVCETMPKTLDLSMANWQIGLNTAGYEVLLPLPGCATSPSWSFM